MIAIILVNWNGTDDTLECLESLMYLNHGDFRIIVVDNDSKVCPRPALEFWAEHGLVNMPEHPIWQTALSGPRRHTPSIRTMDIEEHWSSEPLVSLVKMGWNSGFSHANNAGIRATFNDPAITHFWLLNNDTIVPPDCLDALLAYSSTNSNSRIIGSTLVYYHHDDVVQGVGGAYDLAIARTRQLCNKFSLAELPSSEIIEPQMDFVIGASMFLPRSFIEDVGLMDDRYFLYFEELDWARRLRSTDRLGWARDSIVYHKEGASIGTDSMGRNSATAVYYYNRGLPLFYAKHHPWRMWVVAAKFIFNILRYCVRGDRELALAAWRGAKSGLTAIACGNGAVTSESGPPHLSG